MLISISVSRNLAFFQAQLSLECYFSPLINVKMPTINIQEFGFILGSDNPRMLFFRVFFF